MPSCVSLLFLSSGAPSGPPTSSWASPSSPPTSPWAYNFQFSIFNSHLTLYIFNPEHDLCLANGDPNYVPPASALAFARTGLSAMKTIYGADAEVIPAEDFGKWLQQKYNSQFSIFNFQFNIVPWGWDARLKRTLIKQGCPEEILPTDEWLESLRQLQHRSTIAELQPHATCAYSVNEIDFLLNSQFSILNSQLSIVMKAPWSGAGRGIRFVDNEISDHDRHWAEKVIAEQRCVIVERRLDVREEYAFEYEVTNTDVRQIGLSLFVTQSGVYRHNILLSDDEIRRRLQPHGSAARLVRHSCLKKEVRHSCRTIEEELTQWIKSNVVGRYEGPLGVDMILDQEGNTYVSEFNFRHTMGMVAHASINKLGAPASPRA